MKTSANPIQACLDTLLSPSVAFDTIKDKKGWSWLPFILLASSSFCLFIYYFNVVDFTWLKEQMMNQVASARPMTDEELKGLSSFYVKDTMMWTSGIGSIFAFILFNFISAIYYHIATKVSAGSEYKFTQWYGFTWWASFPIIISTLLGALVVFFATDGMVSMEDLQPTSLNSLLFSVDSSHAWYTILEGINLFSFWTIAVASIGLRSWLNMSSQKSLIIAAAPQVIIYGLWSLYILFLA